MWNDDLRLPVRFVCVRKLRRPLRTTNVHRTMIVRIEQTETARSAQHYTRTLSHGHVINV